jgi:dTDP-4-amino-4,6-dideoxygalactose transaminase
MKVPVPPVVLPSDPGAAYAAYQEQIDQAVRRVIESGAYILGPEVAAFEREFAGYLGVRQAIGVGSGTEALHLALRACGVGPGDVVATVSHTAVATVAAIELAGATPLLIDIDLRSYTMDPQRLEASIRRQDGTRLKVVVPVHLYGHPADLPAILDVAGRYGLTVIEDCAQAHGAAIQGRKVGNWGHAAVFSFYPTKNLGALGDGGAVVTNDPRVGERVRLMREYGWRERYLSKIPGMNSRLDEIQAAILRIKLPHLDSDNDRRRALARSYDALLAAAPLRRPTVLPGMTHVYHQYVVLSPRRDDLRNYLKERSVGTLIHYPYPIHAQPAYQGRVLIGEGGLQQSEQVCREVLSLPLYPQLPEGQVRETADLILRWAGQVEEPR